jgi:hypothetical protein
MQVIKKSYDFYKETGNKWNSRYLSSKKISRYYLDKQNSFLSGPSSPQNLTLQDSLQKTQETNQKVQANKKISKDLLIKRKIERLQLTSTNYSIDPKKPQFNMSGSLNVWDNINELPVSKLKHVIPEKILLKDKEGIKNIMQKSVELKKLDEWNQFQIQNNRIKSRLALAQRHRDFVKLEQKSGIIKIRDKSSPQGVYGYQKVYSFGKVASKLSKSKQILISDQFAHKDFRGLLHADYAKAVSKLNSKETKFSELSSIEPMIQETPSKSSIQIINFE